MSDTIDEETKKVHFSRIRWDKDADDDSVLPLDYTTNVPFAFDVEGEGADLLSDNFGYCVLDFRYEIK